MKKLLLLPLLVSYSFAVTDILYKPPRPVTREMNRVLYSTTSIYPEALSSSVEKDDKNVFVYDGHFRVIYGLEYEDSVSVQRLADTILRIADTVWAKEIEDFAFKEPRNSDNYYIDIYIGNKSAYNKNVGSYVTISSYYAGYATAYSDGTPYFIINPSIATDILEVTIAHEFFHTVQYAYGLGDVSDTIWYKNIWFLEATSVMMEDEVFDDVNDYINYLRYYVDSTNRPLEYYNSGIEYGKVVFAKYLREKYGMDFIKSLFEGYHTDETILQVMEQKFKDNNSSFKSNMLEFASWMADEGSSFEEGESYPPVKRYSLDANLSVGNYGFSLFNSGASNYLISSNPEYLQSTFHAKKDRIDSVDINGLIFLNPNSTTIHTDITQEDKFEGISLRSGWNLIANIFDTNLTLETLLHDDETAWVYRDGNYFAYSADADIEALIHKKKIAIPENKVEAGEGVWVYTRNAKHLDIDKNTLHKFDLNSSKGWQLLSVSSSAFNVNQIQQPVKIWHYNRNMKTWEFYTNEEDNNSSFEKIEKIIPGNGYFVLFE